MFDIITDSACDLTPEMARQLNLTVVPFYVSTDGEHYLKEGQEIAVRDFYQFMVDHPETLPKTSLPSLEDYERVFREKAAAGREALCLCFTGEAEQLPVPCVEYGAQDSGAEQAHALFTALRRLDELGAKQVFARCPADTGVSLAVYNRLLRAAAFRVVEA